MRGYSGDVCQQAGNVVDATMRTYREAMKGLLPTPSKSHYTFNLRDFSRVVQGVLLQAPSGEFANKSSVMRLWTHEALRVFGDRLTDDNDRSGCASTLYHVQGDQVRLPIGVRAYSTRGRDGDGLRHLRRLFWGDYMTRSTRTIGRMWRFATRLRRNRTEDSPRSSTKRPRSPWSSSCSCSPLSMSRESRVSRMPGGRLGLSVSAVRADVQYLAMEMAGYALFRIEITVLRHGRVERRS